VYGWRGSANILLTGPFSAIRPQYIRISLASDIETLKLGVSKLADAAVDVNGFKDFLKQPELYL
jgi:hypothetical protein